MKKQKKTKKCCSKGLISLVAIVLIIVFIIVFWRIFTKQIFEFILNLVKSILELKFFVEIPSFFIIYSAAQAFGIPASTLMSLIMGHLTKSPVQPALYYCFSVFFVSIFHYMIGKYCLKESIKKNYKEKPLYKVIEEEGEKKPCLTAFFMQWIAAPALVINLMLTLAGINFWVYLFNIFIYNLAYGFLIGVVGTRIENVQELIEPKQFSQQTASEIFLTLLGYFGVALTIFALVGISCYIRCKVKKMTKRMEVEAARKKNQVLPQSMPLSKPSNDGAGAEVVN